MSKVEGTIPNGVTLLQSVQPKIAAEDLQISQLQPGEVIDARVEFRGDSSNPNKVKKGVVISGEFVEVALPPEIEQGQEVKLQVVSNKERLQLRFVDIVSKELPKEEIARVTKEITELLKAISISKESINILKSQLSPDRKEITFEINDSIHKQDNSASAMLIAELLDEAILSDPRKLEEKLANQDLISLKKRISELKEIQSNSTPFSRSQFTESRNQIIRGIVSLLEELDLGKTSIVRYEQTKQTNEVADNIQSRNQTALSIVPNKPSNGAISRLIEKLGEIGIKSSEIIVEGEKKLKEVFIQQIEILKSVESRIKKLLVSSSLDSSLDTLKKTVDDIEVNEDLSPNSPQVKFNQFIRDLQVDLQSISKPHKTENEIREVLRRYLDRLYYDLELPKLEQRREVGVPKDLPLTFQILTKEQQNILKNIEVQIKNIILAPEGTLVKYDTSRSENNSQLVKISSKELKNLLEDLKKLIGMNGDASRQLPEGMKNIIQEFELQVEKQLLAKLPLIDIEKNIKALVFNLFRELNQNGFLARPDNYDLKINNHVDFDLKIINLIIKDIKDALGLPSGKLVNLIEEENLSKLPKIVLNSNELKRLQSLLSLVANQYSGQELENTDTLKSITKQFQQLLSEIIMNPKTQEKTEQDLRNLLKDLLPGYEKLVFDLKNPQINTVSFKAQSSPESVILNQNIIETLNGIENLIINVLENIDPIVIAGANTLELNSSLAKSTPKLQELIALLRRAEAMIPDPNSPIEQEFIEYASKLLEHIEKETRLQTGSLNEHLKNGLEHIQRKFIKSTTVNNDELFTLLNRQALSNLESMVQGQEVITKLTPIMQALGEPALAIFPFIIQGFLSKIEMQVTPSKVELYNEEKKDGTKNTGEGFEQIKLNLPLPGLGLVQVGIAYRSSQILISFAFEREELAEFISRKTSKLESILRNSGFDEVEINCISQKNNELCSNWFVDLISKNGTIA